MYRLHDVTKEEKDFLFNLKKATLTNTPIHSRGEIFKHIMTIKLPQKRKFFIFSSLQKI